MKRICFDKNLLLKIAVIIIIGFLIYKCICSPSDVPEGLDNTQSNKNKPYDYREKVSGLFTIDPGDNIVTINAMNNARNNLEQKNRFIQVEQANIEEEQNQGNTENVKGFKVHQVNKQNGRCGNTSELTKVCTDAKCTNIDWAKVVDDKGYVGSVGACPYIDVNKIDSITIKAQKLCNDNPLCGGINVTRGASPNICFLGNSNPPSETFTSDANTTCWLAPFKWKPPKTGNVSYSPWAASGADANTKTIFSSSIFGGWKKAGGLSSIFSSFSGDWSPPVSWPDLYKKDTASEWQWVRVPDGIWVGEDGNDIRAWNPGANKKNITNCNKSSQTNPYGTTAKPFGLKGTADVNEDSNTNYTKEGGYTFDKNSCYQKIRGDHGYKAFSGSGVTQKKCMEECQKDIKCKGIMHIKGDKLNQPKGAGTVSIKVPYMGWTSTWGTPTKHKEKLSLEEAKKYCGGNDEWKNCVGFSRRNAISKSTGTALCKDGDKCDTWWVSSDSFPADGDSKWNNQGIKSPATAQYWWNWWWMNGWGPPDPTDYNVGPKQKNFKTKNRCHLYDENYDFNAVPGGIGYKIEYDGAWNDQRELFFNKGNPKTSSYNNNSSNGYSDEAIQLYTMYPKTTVKNYETVAGLTLYQCAKNCADGTWPKCVGFSRDSTKGSGQSANEPAKCYWIKNLKKDLSKIGTINSENVYAFTPSMDKNIAAGPRTLATCGGQKATNGKKELSMTNEATNNVFNCATTWFKVKKSERDKQNEDEEEEEQTSASASVKKTIEEQRKIYRKFLGDDDVIPLKSNSNADAVAKKLLSSINEVTEFPEYFSKDYKIEANKLKRAGNLTCISDCKINADKWKTDIEDKNSIFAATATDPTNTTTQTPQKIWKYDGKNGYGIPTCPPSQGGEKVCYFEDAALLDINVWKKAIIPRLLIWDKTIKYVTEKYKTAPPSTEILNAMKIKIGPPSMIKSFIGDVDSGIVKTLTLPPVAAAATSATSSTNITTGDIYEKLKEFGDIDGIKYTKGDTQKGRELSKFITSMDNYVKNGNWTNDCGFINQSGKMVTCTTNSDSCINVISKNPKQVTLCGGCPTNGLCRCSNEVQSVEKILKSSVDDNLQEKMEENKVIMKNLENIMYNTQKTILNAEIAKTLEDVIDDDEYNNEDPDINKCFQDIYKKDNINNNCNVNPRKGITSCGVKFGSGNGVSIGFPIRKVPSTDPKNPHNITTCQTTNNK